MTKKNEFGQFSQRAFAKFPEASYKTGQINTLVIYPTLMSKYYIC